MRALVLACLCSLVTSMGLASAARAQEAQAPSEAASPPGADEYTRLISEGVSLMVSGDTDGGFDRFRRALSSDGARPQAPYYIAVLNRAGGNLEEAVSGFQRTAELAERANEPRWQARALQGAAFTLERMEGRIEEARTAWQTYVRFADAHTTVSHPQLGRARIQAIDMVIEQERVYVDVRERIAERERENATPRRRRGR